MTQGVIGATPPGGFGGAGAPPQCVDPLSYLVKLKRSEAIQKVPSNQLKIRQRVAYR